MDLVPRIDSATLMAVGPRAFGARAILGVSGGRVDGDGVHGTIRPRSPGFLVADADGLARVDLHGTLLTDDGVRIAASCAGILELNAAVEHALATRTMTGFGDQRLRVSPRFRTDDARYRWLEREVYVADGHVVPGALECRAHRVR
ncbi:DUF3237 domain-containing protein [Patulibacter sp. NPDC049589]|uniref:DUF3237 domain-containing protein n=1 Tax=Patulibacter sp. NPDC049589 TaxID=3154731 RepID=UPI0034254DFB